MRAMPRSHTATALLGHALRSVLRWRPRIVPMPAAEPHWADTDSSWHASSFELAQGVDVIEHFEPVPVFADTLPALRLPPAGPTPSR
jgi:hypothetical protein